MDAAPVRMTAAVRPAWVTASVLGLVVMATWTLVIKYLAPWLWAVSERAAGRADATAPLMWDFWWVAHLLLAWLLWRGEALARVAGLVIAPLEIGIVAVKLALFARQPDASFWKLLWLTNKLYVLVFFGAFLVLLWRRGRT
jgi:hypothetical protein